MSMTWATTWATTLSRTGGNKLSRALGQANRNRRFGRFRFACESKHQSRRLLVRLRTVSAVAFVGTRRISVDPGGGDPQIWAKMIDEVVKKAPQPATAEALEVQPTKVDQTQSQICTIRPESNYEQA